MIETIVVSAVARILTKPASECHAGKNSNCCKREKKMHPARFGLFLLPDNVKIAIKAARRAEADGETLPKIAIFGNA